MKQSSTPINGHAGVAYSAALEELPSVDDPQGRLEYIKGQVAREIEWLQGLKNRYSLEDQDINWIFNSKSRLLYWEGQVAYYEAKLAEAQAAPEQEAV